MQPFPVQIDEPFLHVLEDKLAHLAAEWRGTDNLQMMETLVHQYQAVLRCMIDLGYRDWLDIEAELPDELMPAEYLNLHR